MLRKTKEQNNIDFLSGNDKITRLSKSIDEESKQKEETIKEKTNRVAEEQKSRKLDSKDDGFKLRGSIMSTGYTGEVEIKPNEKYIKCETSDSIWGPGQLKDKLKIKEDKRDNIQKTIDLEEKMAQQRKADVERSKDILATGGEVVSFAEDKTSHKFNTPSHGIGIFDNEDFERLPNKTGGEKITDEVKEKQAQIDESWKNNGKSISSKDVMNRMFDNLTKNKEN